MRGFEYSILRHANVFNSLQPRATLKSVAQRRLGTTFLGVGWWGGSPPALGLFPAARLLSPSRTPARAFPEPFGQYIPCPLTYTLIRYISLAMKTFLLKIDTAVYLQWQERAKESKLTLSEWIRKQCNGNGSTADKDVPRVAGNGAGAGGAGATEPVFGNASVCAHHKARGSLCYKCDPKFGTPVIA